ncbi:hypothetical protein GS532_10465 [Rhodococcus hoagii]|nr:hypothetical protein [Prescottella equi]
MAVAAGDRTVTYRQLVVRAESLARELVARGAGPGVRVACAVPRSLDSVTAGVGDRSHRCSSGDDRPGASGRSNPADARGVRCTHRRDDRRGRREPAVARRMGRRRCVRHRCPGRAGNSPGRRGLRGVHLGHDRPPQSGRPHGARPRRVR